MTILEAPYDGKQCSGVRHEPNAAVTFGAGTEVRGRDWTGYVSPPVRIETAHDRVDARAAQSGAWNVRGRRQVRVRAASALSNHTKGRRDVHQIDQRRRKYARKRLDQRLRNKQLTPNP